MTNQDVFFFGDGSADGDASQKILLGGKGANLAEMTKIGLPVPPGFTISTNVCSYFYKNNKNYPETLEAAHDLLSKHPFDKTYHETKSVKPFRCNGKWKCSA